MCNNLRKLDATAALLRRRLVWCTQPSVLNHELTLLTPNHSNFRKLIYFNDILMSRFVMSQHPENNFVVQMSRSL